jgi:poly(A) polymerase
VEVTAGSQEDFEVWEGWVHSRMRLLIRSAGNMLDVRPWPKAFRPPPPEPQDAGGGGKGGGEGAAAAAGPRCLYFIGLAKKRPQTSYHYSQAMVIPQSKVDLTGAVNEFSHKVKDWDQRRAGMDIVVRHVTAKALPPWVRASLAKKPAAGAAAAAVEAAAAAGKKRAADGGAAAGEGPPASKRHAAGVGIEVERQEDLADWAAEGEGGGLSPDPDGKLAAQQQAQLAAAAVAAAGG